jgi:hypothetical protein
MSLFDRPAWPENFAAVFGVLPLNKLSPFSSRSVVRRAMPGAVAGLLLCCACVRPVVAQAPAGAPVPEADAPNSTDPALAFGHVPDLDDLTPRVRAIQRRGLVARDASGQPTSAADWMNQSLKWLKAEDYTHAGEGFRKAAAIYRTKGQTEDAMVMETYAARAETRIGLFYNVAANPTVLRQKNYTGQRLEPIYGAYVGAFIDHEDGVSEELHDEDQSTGRIHRNVAEFNTKIGKHHAAFFTYCGYKSGLPDKWFENLKENGAAAQWAIEPNSLEEIKDDDYLRSIARAAADAGVPIFVRFASEMNGGWTPYHTPPALYREKFRIVARVFHQLAPNAAMVWCPNEIPQSNIPDYYPGDDAVDWVGVNFYSVYFNDGNPERPVSWANPADKLDYIYRNYSARRPIMICEWAATHHERADGVDRPSFAAEKIAQLYSSLPRRYPRVKAVFWLDMNAIQYADDPRQRKNDYSLMALPQVAGAYRRMVSSPYFLDHVATEAIAPVQIAPLPDKAALAGKVTLSAYVKTYDGSPTVAWSLNGKPMQTTTDPGAYEWTLDTATLPNGPAKIGLTVLDAKGRVAGRQAITALIHNSAAPETAAVALPALPTAAAPAVPTALPAPVPLVVEPRPLADLVAEAKSAPATLSLVTTPADGKIAMAAGLPNSGLRITATVGPNVVGASPTLAIILIRRDGEGAADNDPTADVIAPAATSIKALTAMVAGPGATISIPSNPTRVLRPDHPGIYTVRAYLFPTREAAAAFVEPLLKVDANEESVHWNAAKAVWAITSFPPGDIFVADREIQVLAK